MFGLPFVYAEDVVIDEVVDETVSVEESQGPIGALIVSDSVVMKDRNIIFDASESYSSNVDGELSYEWHFGDGDREYGVEVVHSYSEPGEYQVTLVVMNDNGDQDIATSSVFVYERTFLLITDNSDESDRLDTLAEYAKEQGVYVNIIGDFEVVSEFLSEEVLLQKLQESFDTIKDYDIVAVWTTGSTGLTLLSRLSQSISESEQGGLFSGDNIVVISDQGLGTLQNIAQGTFDTVWPNQIILTRSEALWPLVDAKTISDFIADLDLRGVAYKVVNSSVGIGITNFMSYFVNYMLEKGVPSSSLKLILMLPIIVTIVAFFKQVIGLETLGVYIPSIITLSFIALGIQFGLFILLVILLFGTLSRLLLKRYRLLYIPRMSIVLTIVSVTILAILLAGAYLDISQLVSISIFPMLIMSTLVENFVAIQTGKGFKSALVIMFEVIFVSSVCYYVTEWSLLKTLMLGHPELILVFLAINIFLGRWTGLRFTEYARFREIFKYSEEE
ncbi:MAG: 7TM domain-containing protein [Candidatus Gracilibacteria bacterium]